MPPTPRRRTRLGPRLGRLGPLPEALAANIFEPFVTSKSAGTGLGLPVTAKIISDHGGVIDYRREEDRSVFRLLLPLWSDATEDSPGDRPAEEAR